MQLEKMAASKGVGPGDLGKMETSVGKQNCSLERCAQNAAVVLAERRLCLEHYFEWCYRQLEDLESQVRRKSMEAIKDAALRTQIEECSNRTLTVSLQHEPLTNQDRSRLLDILLWTGDLLYLMRAPRNELPDSVTYRSHRTRTALAWRNLAR